VVQSVCLRRNARYSNCHALSRTPAAPRPSSDHQFSPTLSKMTAFATLAPSFALADATISGRGAKTCSFSAAGAKHVLTIGSKGEPLSTPFGATSYGEEQTDRKTVEFRLAGPHLAYFTALDEWCIKYVFENSERIFSKKYSLEQCRELGCPLSALSSSRRMAKLRACATRACVPHLGDGQPRLRARDQRPGLHVYGEIPGMPF
jgi:hypothetical protein